MVIQNEISSLEIALSEVHKKIESDFAIKSDVALAKRLEIFLNKIYKYDQEASFSKDASVSKHVDALLSNDMAEKISRDTMITVKKTNWKHFEQEIARIFSKLAQDIIDKDKSVSKNNKKIYQGIKGSYVDLGEIPEEYRDKIMQAFGKQITEKGMSEGISRTYVKQQKNDAVFVEGRLQDAIQEDYAIFKDLGVSIKDYRSSNSSIKLEQVNPLKAYAAILSHYSNLIQSMTKNPYILYFEYYGNQSKKEDDDDVTLHLNHLLSIYGLTGIGAKDAGAQQATQSTRFLIIRNTDKIQVRSTREMVQEVLKNNSEKYLFGSSKSKSAKYATQTVNVKN